MLRRILFALTFAAAVTAAPVVERRQDESTCVNPPTRKAWHTLSRTEQQAYIDAELCLMKLPATLGLRAAKTKFDELQSVHVYQTEIAHVVGQFLPFHRLYVWAHEQSLRQHCNYEGAHPYWAEDLDAGAFSKSIIFDAETGFGGDGAGDALCIQDGPFADYKNAMGPGYKISTHCIERQINDRMSQNASEAHVTECMEKESFIDFWGCVESAPHGAGHGGVGAEMSNTVSSPGDPLFYLHHTWLDRIWARWQDQNPTVRLTEIGGQNTHGEMFGPGGERPPFMPPPGLDFPPPFGDPEDNIRPDDVPMPQVIGDPGNVTTLDHLIQMYGVIPDATVRDVMNIQGGMFCYQYD